MQCAVPVDDIIKLSICIERVNSEILNEIKFHGNPPKIVPLKYSKKDRVTEKIKIELKFILILKNLIHSENNP